MSEPWKTEGDAFDWTDPATGLACRTRRHPEMLHWCGYVGVEPDHPLHGLDGRTRIRLDKAEFERCWEGAGIDEVGVLNLFIAALGAQVDEAAGIVPLNLLLRAHGGVTFTGAMRDARKLWWFGFDCGHGGDYPPGLAETLRRIGSDPERTLAGSVYRTAEFARLCCGQLAEDVAAIGRLGAVVLEDEEARP